MQKTRALLVYLTIIVLNLNIAHAEDQIWIHFVDRPPYAISGEDGTPEGVVATPARKILKKIKAKYGWLKTPVNRQFAIIKENKGFDCALGLEQTPSRSEFSKFTDPVYIGQPLVALINNTIKEKKGVTFEELLQQYAIIVKENYTMGDDITAKVMKSPKKILTSIESPQMVQMVERGRADFMMISNEEIEYYVRNQILDPDKVHVLELPDVKKRFTRRLMCSKSVSDNFIKKINAAIGTLNVVPAKFKKLRNMVRSN